MKIKYYTTAIIVFIVLFGGYGIFKITGLWDDVSNKKPSVLVNANDNVTYDPSTIKGSSKFIELSNWFDMPLEDFGTAFNIPDEQLDTFANKDLEGLYPDTEFELGNGSVKLFIALYKSIPYEITEETYLPTQAIELLKAKAELSDEQIFYIENHNFELTDVKIDNSDVLIPLVEINGKTTFDELIDAGLDKTVIEDIAGIKLIDTNIIIKDFCNKNGLSFSDMKDKLNKETLK